MEEIFVQVPLERYESLLHTEAQSNCLRQEIIMNLQRQLDGFERANASYYGLYNISLDIERISRIMGYGSTFDGFKEKFDEVVKKKSEVNADVE